MPSHTQRRRMSNNNAISFIMSARVRAAWARVSESECGWWAPTENEAGLARPHQREMCAKTT